MEDIHIQAVRDNYIMPAVDFDSITGKCVIKGESFLEETAKFYTPLVEWITRYLRTAKRIELILQLKYFNTSTSKWILTILGVLKEFERNGGEVKVEWYYYKDDTDMRDDIKDYILGSNLKIDMKPFVE